MFNPFKQKREGQTQVFKIDGMHCTSCAMSIDGELDELEGVFDASTNYAKSTTKVSYDPDKVNEKQLIQAIKKAGYIATPHD